MKALTLKQNLAYPMAIFGASYILATAMYKMFLDQFHQTPDPITKFTAIQAFNVLNLILHLEDTSIMVIGNELSYFYRDYKLLSIIEGCNAISVLIIYNLVIMGFSPFKYKTVLYALFTSLFIGLVNVLRISLLGIINLFWHHWTKEFHDIIFPTIIYATIVLLWMVWFKLSD